MRQVRDLESELEDERKQRSAALTARKKIEADFNELQLQMDHSNKQREELVKQSKRLQLQLKDAVRESEEAKVVKDNLNKALREKEDLNSQLTNQLNSVQEELMGCDRERRYSYQIVNLIGDYVKEHAERTGGKDSSLPQRTTTTSNGTTGLSLSTSSTSSSSATAAATATVVAEPELAAHGDHH